MPSIENSKNVFSLLEVTRSIQKTLSERYTSVFWVKAEMNKLNYYKQSGHCYPELVEKKDGRIVAQVRANIWSQQFVAINNKFLEILKEPLKDGIKILFAAKVSFDPAHGLALQIFDIDPAYTLGDLEKEKSQTIQALKDKGIFNANKDLKLPLLPQRIALISVDTSKGYADFINVLNNNQWGYRFHHFLFPSLLQGDKAVDGILFQLKRIKKVIAYFDVVAIIRGGGGDIGLTCYNNQRLCEAIAEFPLPVFTGIGHATNVTVAEMIAHTNAITPTKLAEFLIQGFHDFSSPVQKAIELISTVPGRMLAEEKGKLEMEVKVFKSVAEKIITKEKNAVAHFTDVICRHSTYFVRNQALSLKHISTQIKRSALSTRQLLTSHLSQLSAYLHKNVTGILDKKHWDILRGKEDLSRSTISQVNVEKGKIENFFIYFKKSVGGNLTNEKTILEGIEKTVKNLDPEIVLKRGYSITLHKGKVVSSINQLNAGDILETKMADGKITSIINDLNKDDL